MDIDKVEEIHDWDVPTKVPELESFLGLTNSYWYFKFGYLVIATLLTDILKKSH